MNITFIKIVLLMYNKHIIRFLLLFYYNYNFYFDDF